MYTTKNGTKTASKFQKEPKTAKNLIFQEKKNIQVPQVKVVLQDRKNESSEEKIWKPRSVQAKLAVATYLPEKKLGSGREFSEKGRTGASL